ncbi:MAG TPA: UDP-2,4-diacetamido-2,4,6-trideoxy-beta-L-altropyranose hydrolase [Planctomycetota bacterium]|nr:UDP-2,4-diacetamido-2,4,6-trideoxy-beta-L-altropyranose hydrolase [Planctomycetota bacterium]
MNLLFRCDASKDIGSGHAMRCLALAQEAAAQGARVEFAMRDSSPGILARIRQEGFDVRRIHVEIGREADAWETVKMARAENVDWIVIDGYRFDSGYQRCLVDASDSRVLAFDDYGQSDFYSAHLVLNQNLGADEGLYALRAPHTRLLLGASYALLRREFQRWRDWQRDFASVGNRVLISFGGSDPQNVTLDVLRALEAPEAGALELDVVAGTANTHLDALEKACRNSRHKAALNVNASDMDERMARASAAITAGGSTCWELCFMQLPALVFVLAQNQDVAGGKLRNSGAAVVLGQPAPDAMLRLPRALRELLNDARKRSNMASAGRRLVDGLGAQRVMAEMGKAIA